MLSPIDARRIAHEVRNDRAVSPIGASAVPNWYCHVRN
jgi:hypothetical protein